METILNIADSLGCSLDTLFQGNHDPYKDGEYGAALMAWSAVGDFLSKIKDERHG